MNDETIAKNLEGFARWLEVKRPPLVADRDIVLLREAAGRIRELTLEIQSWKSGPSHPI